MVAAISTRKRDVLTRAAASDVIFMEWKGKYRTVQDHHHLLRLLIDTHRPMIHEYVRKDQPVNLFFDIDFKHTQSRAQLETTLTRENVLDALHDKLLPFLEPFASHRRIVLSSHTADKTSFHIIYKLCSADGLLMCLNKRWIKTNVYDALHLEDLKDSQGQSIIDPAVYNDGTLRTFKSFKEAHDSTPFVFDTLSHHTNMLECFIGYSSSEGFTTTISASGQAISIRPTNPTHTTLLSVELDEQLCQFVASKFRVQPDHISRTSQYGSSHPPVYSIDFKDDPCRIAGREHRSNTQYITVGPKKATYRCFDNACAQQKDERTTVSFTDYTQELKALFVKPSEIVRTQMKAVIRLKTDDSPPGSPVYDVEKGMISISKSPASKFYDENDPGTHVMSPHAYKLRRTSYTTEFNEWDAPLVVQHITVNQNYYGQNDEQSFIISIPQDIFNDTKLTALWEDAINLTGEDTLAELFCLGETTIVYSSECYFVFTGSLWARDAEGLSITNKIKSKLVPSLDKIFRAFETDTKAQAVILKTRRLIDSNKGLANILTRARYALSDEKFAVKLDTRVRLIPFDNGVYDIEHSLFRDYTIDDLCTKTVGYDYDETVVNGEVLSMLDLILPQPDIRNYFMKCCADALDGAIPNTNFVMMIGESASNGKTVLLRLMRLAFGGLCETINPTTLTRKEADAASASPHLAKLQNVRLVCLSEPENGEINTAALKRLFGGETINARFLHRNEVSFDLIAKAFIACNHPPKIDPTDAGVWRRIVCVPFTTRFVQIPTLPNERQLDPTISHRINEDLTYRSSFMNMLIRLLNQTVEIPEAVKLKTTNVKQCNDQFTEWLDGTLSEAHGKLLTLQTIVQNYKGEAVKSTQVLAKYRGRVETYLVEKGFSAAGTYTSRFIETGVKKCCWLGLVLN